MPLGSLRYSPRMISIPVGASGCLPVLCRSEPFIAGQLVEARSVTASAIIVGANLNRDWPTGSNGRYAKFKISAKDIATGTAGRIAQVAAARVTDPGDVSGDLTITFGTADGDIIRAIPTDGAFAAAEVLAMVVMVNGVVYKRVTDAGDPGPGEWVQLTNNFTIKLGASTGANVLKVGAEVEIFIPEQIGVLAQPTAAGLVATATLPLAAGTPEERRLGIVVAGVDTAGRTNAQLCNVDILCADVGVVTMSCITK